MHKYHVTCVYCTSGHFIASILYLQANCVDSTAAPEAVFAGEVSKLRSEKIKPTEQITLEPYERDHAVVVGIYRYILMALIQGFITVSALSEIVKVCISETVK